MTAHADLLAKLRADLAAVSKPAHEHHGDSIMAGVKDQMFCDECQERIKARARLAALPGDKLLERLIEEHAAIAEIAGECEGAGRECGVCDLIADCATALEVEA